MERTNKIVIVLRSILLVLAVVFIVIGFFGGDVRDVWSKAVMICMECIGIG